jgi:hypothetical protein
MAKDSTRRTARTVFQAAVALAAGMPLLIDASGLDDTVPGVAVTLAVSAAITRLMALPLADKILPAFLRKDA